MNLLERMSPEHLEVLKARELEFPLTIKNLIAELESNNHFLDLKDYSVTSLEKLFHNVSS